MLNKVILQGNIGRAPEISLTQEGKKMATFSLATTQSWKDATGEWQSSTDWHRIAVFRDSTIGWVKDVLRRGDSVYVEGKLTYHQWTDKFGQQRSTPHVVITGREGRVEHLLSRPPASHKNISLPLNINSENQTASSDPQ
ncbi:MAG TPA: single-stranded DNA-binding protein [Alphaproteobacteria bacterium]|nr:single-stranded DNA-binding protein [Alphaproteobacteria bacterium]